MIAALLAIATALPTPAATTTTVRFEGNREVPSEALVDVLDRAQGFRSVLSDELLARDGLLVLAAYYDLGYVEARVTQERETSPDHSLVTGVFRIHEGPVFRVGKVSVTGDRRSFAPALPTAGEIFNRSQIVRMLELLRTRYGAIEREPLITPITSVDAEKRVIDLRIEITHDPSRRTD